MIKRYRFMNEEQNLGIWINEFELLNLIKLTLKRNNKLAKRLIEGYEHIEQKKFNLDLLGGVENE